MTFELRGVVVDEVFPVSKSALKTVDLVAGDLRRRSEVP
jgi:hypothetical protein